MDGGIKIGFEREREHFVLFLWFSSFSLRLSFCFFHFLGNQTGEVKYEEDSLVKCRSFSGLRSCV